MMRRSNELVWAWFALACALPAAAGTGGGLEGLARDAAGAPLPGVIVTVSTAAEGGRAVTTGSDGRFRVPDLAPATYRVVGAKTGWVTRELTGIAVPAGRITAVELVLAQRGAGPPDVHAAVKAAPRPAPAPAAVDDVRVLSPTLRDDFELQTWLNEQSAGHLELLSIVAAGDRTLFVLAPARQGQASSYTALAVSEPVEPERIAARVAQQKNKTFVGLVPLSGDRRAYVFRNVP